MPPSRGPRTLVHIVDGTLSSLEPGRETHAGRLHALLSELAPRADLMTGYHRGIQGAGLDGWLRAASGKGLDDAILHAYAHLASRYRPGDKVFLFGYSRGAYAVRSLAGLVDRVGLLRPDHAIERRVRRAFRLYRQGSDPARAAFNARHCHPEALIEMIGVWDTVKALGLPYPILSRIHPMATEFHDHALGPHIRNGFQALALDEDRTAFEPVMWERAPGWHGRLEQLWFPGAHADIGGMLDGYEAARPLSDLSLLWMLERAEALGLPLPDDWRGRLSPDPTAPMHGARRGLGRLFLFRRPRRIGFHSGEDLHPSVARRMESLPYVPLAEGLAPED